MGCYIDRSNQNCSLSKDNNIIYLCKEYIEEFVLDFNNISYNEMFDFVFCHEFGHLVFSYLDYDRGSRTLSEGRANFFASYLLNMVDEKYISLIKIITKKPILPSNEELAVNSRSKSAKLRVAEKI